MNCCNHNCNQGRDCPSRVTKIGRRYHAKEPCLPSPAPRRLKRMAKWMLIGIATVYLPVLALLVLHA